MSMHVQDANNFVLTRTTATTALVGKDTGSRIEALLAQVRVHDTQNY